MSEVEGSSPDCVDSPLSEAEAVGMAEGMGGAIAIQDSNAKTASDARAARSAALFPLYVEVRVDSLITGFHSLEEIS